MVEQIEFEPWQRFSEWVHSICVVTFDLEIGQALEIIYPGDAELSTVEKTNICYLAFPDSNSGNNKDTNFHFRIRRHKCVLTEAQEALYLSLPPSTAIDPCYLYGYVHFRQQKDPSIPRGYFQKSLVLLSVLPFVNLFSTVVEQIALQYFEVGEPAIEAGCHDLDCWPAPESGMAYSLPLLGTTIHCRIPSLGDFPYETRTTQMANDFTASIVLPTIGQVDVYKALNTTLNNVQLLWELVMLGEPLLVMGSGPARCSAVVQALVSLIAPLKYSNDFRPFFTIHDSEFKEFSHRERSPPKVLLGVTNPFFLKAMDHWPHILKIGDVAEGVAVGDKQEKTRKTWDGKTLDSKAGLYTQYKPFLTRDKAINKKLMKSDRPDEAQCSIMKRHFLELTQSFMIPLERYLSSLMPLRKEMTPFKAMPSTRPFSMEDFLATLEEAGPGLTCGVKGDWAGLYQRFMTSSNFAGWFSHRTRDVHRQLKCHYVEVLSSADLSAAILADKHQVEVVDLVLRYRRHINDEEIPEDKQKLLTKQVITILTNVDDELKQVLMSNCALREVIS